MSKKREDLKVLLLQIRDDKRVRQEELDSFTDYAGLDQEQIDVLNVFDTPSFDPSVVDEYDGIFIGGASEASVLDTKTYPFVIDCQKLILHCLNIDMPVFASCFGFELAVLALGGEVLDEDQYAEGGTIPIRITDLAKTDPVFAGTPDNFIGVSYHNLSSTSLPENCKLLAYTDICKHAFKVEGKRFWATQFHPELDIERLAQRLTIYKAHYSDSDEHLKEMIDAFQPATDSHKLIGNFVERVLL